MTDSESGRGGQVKARIVRTNFMKDTIFVNQSLFSELPGKSEKEVKGEREGMMNHRE